MGMWKEFKDFAFMGNVVDMAVGVMIGGAFGKIVSSVVDDLIMPLISVLTGGITVTRVSTLANRLSPLALNFLICKFARLLVDRKSTRLNSSHTDSSRMPSSA